MLTQFKKRRKKKPKPSVDIAALALKELIKQAEARNLILFGWTMRELAERLQQHSWPDGLEWRPEIQPARPYLVPQVSPRTIAK